jgi:hypothetical protein
MPVDRFERVVIPSAHLRVEVVQINMLMAPQIQRDEDAPARIVRGADRAEAAEEENPEEQQHGGARRTRR